ncbi:GNAT family N-acetyltransferase [Nocardioides sp. W7]|uniref:GNAT family N-acetyltransferase n=1 Tax=Nocardioides sp. W7 TaxID=2931390 RepID=UPI001FD3BE07|nr:GNAT family N-acetyltransferase [Nocardioides sp. W7]
MTALPGPPPATWNALALQARNVFATHTWASTWWDEYGAGAVPHVLYDDPVRPRIVLPLQATGRLLRQVRWIGHGPADLLGPVCAPEDLGLAAPLLRKALAAGDLRTDVVLLQDGPVAAPWWQELETRPVSTEGCPVVRFTPGQDWPQWLAEKSKNFRYQVTKKRAVLERGHEVSFRLATAETFDDDLAALFTLHDARWQGESPLTEPRQRRFTSAFAAAALEQDWLRLWTMSLDGRCVAALLGFRFGPDFYCYQFGRDPALERESVGFVLLTHVVRDAIESGAAEFRFLRGDEDYKHRFATHDAGIATVAVPLGVRGRVAVAMAARRRSRPDVVPAS